MGTTVDAMERTMASADVGVRGSARAAVHHRDSLEFARFVNISDAIFGFALTLLVLGIEVPDSDPRQLAANVRGTAPQLAAFVLGFALVANVWWQHHKLVARLERIDTGMIVLGLATLGVVALVPFPTGVLGRHPFEVAAVVSFAGVFLVLELLFLLTVVRAQRTQAWTRVLPAPLFRWIVAGYIATAAMKVLAIAIATWSPPVGLGVLAASSLPELVVARRAPPGYREWA
jgi:uncharacterized membrane protein